VRIAVPFLAETIEIVNSIPESEKQTARWVYEDAKDVQYHQETAQCAINYSYVSSAHELFVLLMQLAERAASRGDWPLLHLESHGSQQGLTLANGNFVSWVHIEPFLNRLNRATRNHLFIVVGACWGFHGIKAMVGHADHSASLRLLAGPAGETTSGDIEEAMKCFYRALLKGGSIGDAETAARFREPTFRVYSAEQAFIRGWKDTVRSYPATSQAIQAKAEEIVTAVKLSSAPLPERPHRRAKEAIRSLNLDVPFENFKRAFFMLDSFPEVRQEVDWITIHNINDLLRAEEKPEDST
jgi:hypothetical protein